MTHTPHSLGGRIRYLRNWRQLNLAQLAGLAGLSESYLSRAERGERTLSRQAITAIANALRVSATELIGQPVTWQDPALADAQATIPAVRHALVSNRLGAATTAPTRPVIALAADVDRLVRARTRADFGAMGDALPALLTELYAAVAATSGDERALAVRQLVRALNTAMTLASAFGYADLAYMVSERSVQAAAELGSPAWDAIATFSQVHALAGVADHEQAFRLAAAAVDQTGAAVTADRDPNSVAAYGALCMVSGLMAAGSGHAADAAARIDEAAEVAERTGESGPDTAFFGPTNVRLYRMQGALEAGDAERAVELADQVDPELIASQERRGQFYLTRGRVLAELGGRGEDAVGAFLAAERVAPARLRSHVLAREVITGLLPAVRPDSGAGRELRGLLFRLGAAL
ncbi:helix-turn-helix domain-containing protein [Actinosynnema sp. NPDC059335]|uniref:helix-turn-helix domain-containing protein n=1 Tax=Actinosynnema sp. NPDC059335 TaxID=3346804 RepID=UPI00366DBAFB